MLDDLTRESRAWYVYLLYLMFWYLISTLITSRHWRMRFSRQVLLVLVLSLDFP